MNAENWPIRIHTNRIKPYKERQLRNESDNDDTVQNRQTNYEQATADNTVIVKEQKMIDKPLKETTKQRQHALKNRQNVLPVEQQSDSESDEEDEIESESDDEDEDDESWIPIKEVKATRLKNRRREYLIIWGEGKDGRKFRNSWLPSKQVSKKAREAFWQTKPVATIKRGAGPKRVA